MRFVFADKKMTKLVGAQNHALMAAPAVPTTPGTVTLQAVADQLNHLITDGEPEQVMALVAILIADPQSTAAQKSYPPTASAHPRFARRQVPWTLAGED